MSTTEAKPGGRHPLLNFRLEREKQMALRRLADARGVSVSELMRRATEKLLDEETAAA